MIGPILCAVARAAAPTLGQVFVRAAVNAAAMAAGTAAISAATRVIRDQYEKRQRESLPQLQNYNGRWY